MNVKHIFFSILLKTYCQDRQVTDSAASGTAYLCGVKTNIGTIGVDAGARRGDCASQKGSELTSILDWSMAAGAMFKPNILFSFLFFWCS